MNDVLAASAMKILGMCVIGAALLTACGSDESPSSEGPATAIDAAEEPDTAETEAAEETTTTTTAPSSTTTQPPTTTTEAPPASSCDGSTLALTGQFGEADSLYLFDLTSETLVDVLPNGPSEPRAPVWSSGCDAIFFVSPGPDDSSLVNRVDLDSQAVTFVFQHELPIQHLVVNDDAEVFEFSSIDSGEFASADDTTYLTRYTAETGDSETYFEVGPRESWVRPQDLAATPSGTWLLHDSPTFSGIEIFDDDFETSVVELGELPLSPFRRDCCEISPNGQKVAIETALGGYGDTGSANALALVDLASSEAQVVTKDGEDPYFYGSILSPAWSSDSSQVIFIDSDKVWSQGPDSDTAFVFLEGTIRLWLAADDNAEASLIASFDMASQYFQGEVAWMPNS